MNKYLFHHRFKIAICNFCKAKYHIEDKKIFFSLGCLMWLKLALAQTHTYIYITMYINIYLP